MASILLLRSRSSTVFIHLTDDSLTVGRCSHEIWLSLDANRSIAVSTVAVCSVHLPNVLSVVVVITRVVRVSVRMVVDIGRRALTRESLGRIVTEGAVKPVSIERTIARGSGRRILRGTIAGVGRGERSIRPGTCGILVPSDLVWTVRRLLLSLLVALEAGKAFVLSNLLLAPDLVGLVLIGLAWRANEVGLDGGDQGCDSLTIGHGLGNLLAVHPVAPAIQPRVVILAALQVNIEVPVDATEPLSLQFIQL